MLRAGQDSEFLFCDEYAFHKWSESEGVDRFFENKDVEIRTMNYICPTAYVVKK